MIICGENSLLYKNLCYRSTVISIVYCTIKHAVKLYQTKITIVKFIHVHIK